MKESKYVLCMWRGRICSTNHLLIAFDFIHCALNTYMKISLITKFDLFDILLMDEPISQPLIRNKQRTWDSDLGRSSSL